MESLKEIIIRQHDNRVPHDDPLTDRLLAEVVRLAEEVCVLRDRLDTCESLSAAGEVCSRTAIDSFQVSQELIEQRLTSHQAFFSALFARLGM